MPSGPRSLQSLRFAARITVLAYYLGQLLGPLPGIGRSSCGSARLPGMDALVSPCREPATGPRGRGRALESETRRAETRDPRRAIRSSAR
jgi:hypothetical protein